MASSSSTQSHSITLHFRNLVRVAGETIEGRVDLNVPLALRDGINRLRIEMKGVIKTQIRRSNGENSVTHEQTVPLCTESQDLWTGSSSAQDVLSFPFRFTLPRDLPPSFWCGKYSPDATICYSLEAIGERAGKFHRNRRVRKIFPVMPVASDQELLIKETLRQGWKGRWNVTEKHDKVRTGIWGDYSHVNATLSLPELASFPVATPIPYTLHIVTETKPLVRSDRPEDKHGRPLFPAPPTDSFELTQEIRRKTEYHVKEKWAKEKFIMHDEKQKETFDLHRGRSLAAAAESGRVQAGTTAQEASTKAVQAVVDEPVWVPQEEGRGVWPRSVRFNSILTFPFAPTWSTETVDWEYTLQFVLPFPGIGNDLKLEIPIHLGPASACPPPPTGAPGSSGLTYADVLPAGPPPMLDLPPAYWTADAQDWDDEKKEKD
ncbi:hypothetical protein DFH06DRAFT_1215212 [Mycena polygramma]|nr:hypothetical protein DFH06DRAFT_1215212 [Mycena polygramma]